MVRVPKAAIELSAIKLKDDSNASLEERSTYQHQHLYGQVSPGTAG